MERLASFQAFLKTNNVPSDVMKLSPTEIFKGKKIFFIAGTGFVGKVTLSMLLHNFQYVGFVETDGFAGIGYGD